MEVEEGKELVCWKSHGIRISAFAKNVGFGQCICDLTAILRDMTNKIQTFSDIANKFSKMFQPIVRGKGTSPANHQNSLEI